MEHEEYPIFSVQYHPEASPGPHDADYLFSKFIEMMKANMDAESLKLRVGAWSIYYLTELLLGNRTLITRIGRIFADLEQSFATVEHSDRLFIHPAPVGMFYI